MYEFLYGYPPFHAETPMKVFENILSHNLVFEEAQSEEDDESFPVMSSDCQNLIEQLLCLDIEERLGCQSGANEVQKHVFFTDIDWISLPTQAASFIPQVENVDDTSYFDSRGVQNKAPDIGADEDSSNTSISTPEESKRETANSLSAVNYQLGRLNLGQPNNTTYDSYNSLEGESRSRSNSMKKSRSLLNFERPLRSSSVESDQSDFGSFVYKNLALLEKANNDVVQKLRSDGIKSSAKSSSTSLNNIDATRRTIVALRPQNMSMPANEGSSILSRELGGFSSPPTLAGADYGELNRKDHDMEDFSRRSSLPGHARTRSIHKSFSYDTDEDRPEELPHISRSRRSSSDTGSNSNIRTSMSLERSHIAKTRPHSASPTISPLRSSSHDSPPISSLPSRNMQAVLPENLPPRVLIADDNPVSSQLLERMLAKIYNCESVVVHTGAEALRLAVSDVQFDLIILDLRMPLIDGNSVCRMIKNVHNVNSETPIVAVTAYDISTTNEYEEEGLFDIILQKPITLEMVKQLASDYLGIQ